ncbi:MAG: 30S ribosomal protein S8 [Candidatus Nanohalarchaeota archaeon]|nr:MAG: 30S ribosomal protein S8 [Candidatus Nanohaloarchaeota archaeon]
MMHNPLSDALSIIKNAEKAGNQECTVKHVSNLLKDTLKIMNKHGYIGNYKEIEDNKGNQIKIKLIGKINDCKTILPRQPIKKHEYEKWEKRTLPAAGVGTLIISTSEGTKSHRDTRDRIGGFLIAYIY